MYYVFVGSSAWNLQLFNNNIVKYANWITRCITLFKRLQLVWGSCEKQYNSLMRLRIVSLANVVLFLIRFTNKPKTFALSRVAFHTTWKLGTFFGLHTGEIVFAVARGSPAESCDFLLFYIGMFQACRLHLKSFKNYQVVWAFPAARGSWRRKIMSFFDFSAPILFMSSIETCLLSVTVHIWFKRV